MQTDQKGPELRVPQWIDAQGQRLTRPLKLADLGSGTRILFAFQDWCPGCHAHGFPTLQRLHSALAPRGVGFAAVQTVFEGSHTNTFDKLRQNQLKYELPIPFGHDLPEAGRGVPTFMEDYHSGGTPWFTIIDAQGRIVFADFHLDADRLLALEMAADGDAVGEA